MISTSELRNSPDISKSVQTLGATTARVFLRSLRPHSPCLTLPQSRLVAGCSANGFSVARLAR